MQFPPMPKTVFEEPDRSNTETVRKTPVMSTVKENASWTTLIRDLRTQVLSLLKAEITLAKTEMKQIARNYAGKSVLLFVGVPIVLTGGWFLLLALALLGADLFERLGISRLTALWLGFAATGGLFVVGGGVTALVGVRGMKKLSVRPEKTISAMKDDDTSEGIGHG